MLKELLLPEIEDLIEQNQWEDISEILSLWQEAETADLITSIKKNEDKINIFKTLPKEYSIKVFPELVSIDQEHIIESMTDDEKKRIT
ncbi:magnesium transporter MgtE N-terminal domain-containing protein [Brachyspira pilosicoli]|uniref:magnesium transporter MgtE N-terminal domain-containing protein n=1 Tax=Brachyspira pilosicoli TaxID=52584 RepID=UPI0003116A28|nr:hypothetical protein [Brachyspira pilosicoli]